MRLEVYVHGLSAIVRNRKSYEPDPAPRTPDEVRILLLVGPPVHLPRLTVDAACLDTGTTWDDMIELPDDEGRQLAIWNLTDKVVSMPGDAGEVEFGQGSRSTRNSGRDWRFSEPREQDEKHWSWVYCPQGNAPGVAALTRQSVWDGTDRLVSARIDFKAGRFTPRDMVDYKGFHPAARMVASRVVWTHRNPGVELFGIRGKGQAATTWIKCKPDQSEVRASISTLPQKPDTDVHALIYAALLQGTNTASANTGATSNLKAFGVKPVACPPSDFYYP